MSVIFVVVVVVLFFVPFKLSGPGCHVGSNFRQVLVDEDLAGGASSKTVPLRNLLLIIVASELSTIPSPTARCLFSSSSDSGESAVRFIPDQAITHLTHHSD